MATFLGPEFPPTFAGRPTRMSPEDLELWRRWWPQNRTGVRRLWFDVGVGPGAAMPADTPAELAFQWTRNTQKRIDALLERASTLDVIELRTEATLNSLGRLAGYRLLLRDDAPTTQPIRAILVTDREDSDVARLATDLGVTIEVV